MQPLPRSQAGWTMAVFGVLAAVMGVMGLIAPDALLSVMGFTPAPDTGRGDGDHTPVFVTASSMAALNMGVYYVLAALSDWRPFFRWTVPFRLLTCTVFTLAVIGDRAPAALIGVAAWEGLGALATWAALHRDKSRAEAPHLTPA
ncbi:hypothetical protein G5C51_22580 [Streptomyces sp. A7024]|uniref:Uncharacterized protein n=1 Tax=Streptomyces coryli TaxID=1128680 RepID=A0A6G4U5V4_9ACTN|nr:hypothetical protein [Streptomyces coryli]NGN66677.1 hypothetical protein [Streptomyces coryli]